MKSLSLTLPSLPKSASSQKSCKIRAPYRFLLRAVNLEEGATYDERTQALRIPDQPKAAWVIDGQHRMFGLRQAKTRYDLVITAFLGLDVAAQAKQFKIINSKQKGRLPGSSWKVSGSRFS